MPRLVGRGETGQSVGRRMMDLCVTEPSGGLSEVGHRVGTWGGGAPSSMQETTRLGIDHPVFFCCW